MQEPTVKQNMLIRKPVNEVFRAFIDPEITTKFWFTKSSGLVEPGKKLSWDWEMYGLHTDVDVKGVDPNKRIHVEWGGHQVEWNFDSRPDGHTMVTVRTWGFSGNNDDEIVAQAIDNMGGFTYLLAGLKAYLEHNIQLDLVADKAPDAHVQAWKNKPTV